MENVTIIEVCGITLFLNNYDLSIILAWGTAKLPINLSVHNARGKNKSKREFVVAAIGAEFKQK